MRKGMAVLTLGAILVPAPRAGAADHLLSSAQLDTALAAARAGRQADLARLERVLGSPAAERAAARLGADLGQVRTRLATLSDAEIRDLAGRAASLDADPAAGLTHDVEELLVIFLIVAIVLLVLKAV